MKWRIGNKAVLIDLPFSKETRPRYTLVGSETVISLDLPSVEICQTGMDDLHMNELRERLCSCHQEELQETFLVQSLTVLHFLGSKQT